MPQKIRHYRPQRSSPESLEAISVAREHLLQEILERLGQWRPGASRQHFLLIGPRGIGKTHVLSLTAHRISIIPHLNKVWFPVVFPEESYNITKISDLLLKALRILVDETGDKEAAGVFQKVRYDADDARVTDLVLDAFRKFHREKGTGFLFLIENVNRILEQQIKDKTQVHLLRKILTEEDWLVIVCTSPTYLDAVTKEDEPLFEFFQVRFLAELSQKEQLEMLEKLAFYEDNKAFQAYMQKYRSRLLALYHFTGGNPRLTIMLYDLVSYQAITDVQEELERLLDKITPFYQDRMKDIGEQEGKLVETMALLAEGSTPTELAMESRMEAKTVRTVLGRLEKAGYVRREQRRHKKTVYIIPERLFRIWHQMNHSRAGRGLISYLLEFFSTWYQTKEERDEVWNDILKEMEKVGDGDDDYNDDLNEYINYLIVVSEGSERIEREFDLLRKLTLPKGEDAIESKLKELDTSYETDGNYYIHKGYFYAKDLKQHEFALSAFRKASQLRPTDVVPIFNQALTFEILKREEKADAMYLKAAGLLTNRTDRIDSFETLNALLSVLRDGQNSYASMIASRIIGKFADDKISDEIISILKHSREDWRRQYCITALGLLNALQTVPLFLNYLNDSKNNIRGSAATALGRIGSEKAVELLIKTLQDEANDVRGSAASALGRIGSEKAIEPLIKALQDEARNVRGSAILALERFTTEMRIFHLDKVIDKIMENLTSGPGKINPSVVRYLIKAAYQSADLEIISSAIESAKKYLELDDFFYLPYEIAFDYIKSNYDPAVIDRQHPEMRDAVQLLVGIFQKGEKEKDTDTSPCDNAAMKTKNVE